VSRLLDMAFAFSYEHMLTGWRKQGAEVSFFSPLDDAGPDLQADAVFLPGGYPEIYAGRISANRRFLSGLRQAAGRGAVIYGECGGYMVLGAGLIDGNGTRHEMADLLPVETSFLVRQRTLGYRRAVASDAHPFAPGATLRCHEFHYATLTSTETGDLYRMSNIDDDSAVMVGSISGRVAGSFLHVIDIE
jgi:cobyrinic acid a,c-diamide synthase